MQKKIILSLSADEYNELVHLYDLGNVIKNQMTERTESNFEKELDKKLHKYANGIVKSGQSVPHNLNKTFLSQVIQIVARRRNITFINHD